MLVEMDTCRKRCAVGRQGHFIAVAVAFLIACAVLLMVGASGVRAEHLRRSRDAPAERYPKMSDAERHGPSSAMVKVSHQ